MVVINMDKARVVTKERLRDERSLLFPALDIAFYRALEEGRPTTDIVAEKQRLRDITLLADTAETLDELKAIKAS